MSASGYKQTSRGQLANVCFTPKSGHSEARERVGLKKRTLDVRLAPNSGHKWPWCGMSAFDPKRTLAIPEAVEHWSLTTLREKLVKIGAKVVSHGRYVTFQLAEVAVPRKLFRKILSLIDDLRRRPVPA